MCEAVRHRPRGDRRAPRRARRDGPPLHRRVDGLRRRREDRARVRARAAPSGVRSCCVAASGGARMQEGMLSLMQMAKTAAAARAPRRGGRPVHRRPDRSRRTAASPRRSRRSPTSSSPSRARASVSRVPTSSSRPSGSRCRRASRRAESLEKHGMIDAVVAARGPARDARAAARLPSAERGGVRRGATPVRDGVRAPARGARGRSSSRAQAPPRRRGGPGARRRDRPSSRREIARPARDAVPLADAVGEGAGVAAPGPAARAGLRAPRCSTTSSCCAATASTATTRRCSRRSRRIDGRRCVVLAHRKGRDLKENLTRNFGQPHPEGFRKSLPRDEAGRAVRPAGRLASSTPPGAYPGIEAEERGQGVGDRGEPRDALGAARAGRRRRRRRGRERRCARDRLRRPPHHARERDVLGDQPGRLRHDPAQGRDRRPPRWRPSMRMTADDLREMGLADEVLPEPLGRRAPRPGRRLSARRGRRRARARRAVGPVGRRARDRPLRRGCEVSASIWRTTARTGSRTPRGGDGMVSDRAEDRGAHLGR